MIFDAIIFCEYFSLSVFRWPYVSYSISP